MNDKTKAQKIKQLVDTAMVSLQNAQALLEEMAGPGRHEPASVPVEAAEGSVTVEGGVRIIEGVFDGQNMVGPDGKKYSVPANYASKSKLVEGDRLKLTIDRTGSFIYKQIGPVDRERKTGILTQDPESDEYTVLADGKMYKVLLASVTYFKGEPGDEAIILVPRGKESTWAAVENIIKELPSEEDKHSQEFSEPSYKEENQRQSGSGDFYYKEDNVQEEEEEEEDGRREEEEESVIFEEDDGKGDEEGQIQQDQEEDGAENPDMDMHFQDDNEEDEREEMGGQQSEERNWHTDEQGVLKIEPQGAAGEFHPVSQQADDKENDSDILSGALSSAEERAPEEEEEDEFERI